MDVVECGIEPALPMLGREQDRHAVMHRVDGRNGGSREERASVEGAALRRRRLPDGGDAEGCAVGSREVIRKGLSTCATPFVEAVRNEQATAATKGVCEWGAFGEAFVAHHHHGRRSWRG